MNCDDIDLDDLPWQDIHTAPRDGTLVTLLLPSRAGWRHNAKPWRWCDRTRQARWITHQNGHAAEPCQGWQIVAQHGLPTFFLVIEAPFGMYPSKRKIRPLGWLDMRTTEFLHDYFISLHEREKAMAREQETA